jgi:hypothetical protein
MKLTHTATTLDESATSLTLIHITGSTVLGNIFARQRDAGVMFGERI